MHGREHDLQGPSRPPSLHRLLTVKTETDPSVSDGVLQGYMKGYISHSHQLVVLSAKNAFPTLGSRVASGN